MASVNYYYDLGVEDARGGKKRRVFCRLPFDQRKIAEEFYNLGYQGKPRPKDPLGMGFISPPRKPQASALAW